jgi:hypothetical protein
MEKNPSFRPMPEWIKIPEPRSIHTHSFNTAETKAFHAVFLFNAKRGFQYFVPPIVDTAKLAIFQNKISQDTALNLLNNFFDDL